MFDIVHGLSGPLTVGATILEVPDSATNFTGPLFKLPPDHRHEVESDSRTTLAFPTAKTRAQRSIHRPSETWDTIDGAADLSFETEIVFRQNDYEDVHKCIIHDILLLSAVQQLTTADIADAFNSTREDRNAGSSFDDRPRETFDLFYSLSTLSLRCTHNRSSRVN